MRVSLFPLLKWIRFSEPLQGATAAVIELVRDISTVPKMKSPDKLSATHTKKGGAGSSWRRLFGFLFLRLQYLVDNPVLFRFFRCHEVIAVGIFLNC